MADKKERVFDNFQKAAINVENNAVVSAGAGSGKTTVLSERFLHLIQKGYNVDEILTLTFTKKATVEMAGRIYEVLKNKAPEQAANFYKANIKTLDSYCNSVAKIGAHLYGISPDFTQDNETITNQAYEKALPFILKHRDNLAIKELVNTKDYAQIAQELFVNPILSSSTIAEPIDFDNAFEKQIEKIVEAWAESVKKIDDELNCLVGLYNTYDGNRTIKFLSKLKTFIEDNELPGAVSLSKDDITSCNDSISEKIEEYTSIINELAHISQVGANAEGLRPIKEVLNKMREDVSILISICNYVSGFPLTKELIPLLKEFQDIVNNIKRSNGILTFTDISHMALCILRDYPEIRALEKEKYKAIMIDEFQDNNSAQKNMLFLLAEKPERMEKGVPSIEELCPDKLFFVGDEKQSIYLFRGAEVEVFRGLSEDFKDGNLEMSTNYRSNQALIASFNTIFGGYQYPPQEFISAQKLAGIPSVFYTESESQEEDIPLHEAVYKKVTLSKDATDAVISAQQTGKEAIAELYKPKVHIALYDHGQEAPENYLVDDEAEAEWVAKKIEDLISQGEDPSSMAILLRKYSYQPLYERAFLRHGIPYNTETVTGLYSDGPVNDIMALLKLCVHPQDTISYAQVLRSPFMNLTLGETMAILSKKEKPFSNEVENLLEGKSAEIFKKMQEIFEILSTNALTDPITKTITYLWYNIGYRFETMWNHTVEMYSKLYDLLFELARKADQDNLGLSGFVDLVDSYKTENSKLDDMDIPLDQSSGVHIMTIHKSKGLEFDTVFVCATHSGSLHGNNSSPVYCSKDFGITINTPPCKTFSKIKSQYFYDRVKAEKDEKRAAELRRVTYVALTRAKKNLYITSGKYKHDDKAYEKFIPGGTGNADSILKILSPVINFYMDENNVFASPFDIEPIGPYPRFANDSSENSARRNTVSAKRLLLEQIIEKSPYENSAACGKIITKDILVSKYTNPSHLHPEDDETSHNIESRYTPVPNSVYPEISKYVYDSIPAEDLRKSKSDPNYEPKPRFDFTNFGTIAHAYMEAAMNKTEPQISNKEWAGLDNNQEKIARIQQICAEMCEKFKNSEIGKAAVGSTEYYAEYEFRSRIENKIVKGIIDLVFKNPDGTFTVLDYKTNQTEEPEIYYSQLACYRQAVAQMFGIKDSSTIKCYLYYLRSGHEVNITEECSKIDLAKAVQEI